MILSEIHWACTEKLATASKQSICSEVNFWWIQFNNFGIRGYRIASVVGKSQHQLERAFFFDLSSFSVAARLALGGQHVLDRAKIAPVYRLFEPVFRQVQQSTIGKFFSFDDGICDFSVSIAMVVDRFQ